jgi:LuxR family transcriptional regulator, quorum-sensing system regulator CviR
MKGVFVMLPRREANTLLEIMDVSLHCTREEELRRIVLRLQGLIPYEFALCALSGISCRSNEPYRMINVSYPSSWLEVYISEQFDKIDPVVAEHRLHFSLQYWPDSYRKHPEAKQFVTSASDYGLKTGYSYGLKTPGSDNATLFCFGGRSMERQIRTSDILWHIVPHLHEALVRSVTPQAIRSRLSDSILSLREKEVLNWVKVGKTTWEISMILTISERTVKFHIQNILQKVDATNRAQAVAICMEKGVIDVD